MTSSVDVKSKLTHSQLLIRQEKSIFLFPEGPDETKENSDCR